MYGYIYRITDLTNGMCYIGQHKYDKPMLDPKYHGSSAIIKNQIKKHPKNFLEEIIFIAATLDELNYFETYFIEHLNTLYPNGYNITHGGNKYMITEQTHEKLKNHVPWNKGQRGIYSDETIAKMSNSKKGKPGPRKGKKASNETRQKLSDSHKGKPSHRKGKKVSNETLLKQTKFFITKEELYNQYITKGLSSIKIAKIYGCSGTTIMKKIKKYNIIK